MAEQVAIGEAGSPSEIWESSEFMKNISDGELSSLTSKQTGFIVSLRSIGNDIKGDALRELVAEMFPPAYLFHPEICDLPSAWIDLRTFLQRRGVTLQQHSSRRVLLTLAHGLYNYQEDTAAAVESANLIVRSSRATRTDLDPTAQQPIVAAHGDVAKSQNQSADRVAHNVAMRLKDSEKKFSGDLGQCWIEYVDEYQQISRDYNLSASQKLQYLHNILCKDAYRFYCDRVQSYATSFNQAVSMIDQEYNSPVRQTRVKNYLKSLRVSDFEKNGDEVSTALARVYKLKV